MIPTRRRRSSGKPHQRLEVKRVAGQGQGLLWSDLIGQPTPHLSPRVSQAEAEFGVEEQLAAGVEVEAVKQRKR